jgi:hypothetical protein
VFQKDMKCVSTISHLVVYVGTSGMRDVPTRIYQKSVCRALVSMREVKMIYRQFTVVSLYFQVH